MNKLAAVVVIIVLLGLGSTALIFSGALTGSIPSRGATTSSNESQVPSIRTTSSNELPASTTRTASGNASNSFNMNMNVLPTIRLLPLGGGANYTVILYNDANLSGSYSLAAIAPSGLSFKFGAASVDMSHTGPHVTYALVNSSSQMSPGAYQVTIVATGPKGAANQTFDLHVQRNLVILSALSSTTFSKITVKAGDSVTWVSWDGAVGDDDPNFDYHHVIFLTGNLTSGLLDQYQTWSHTFTQPGIYQYYDSIVSPFPFKGEVIVSP